MQNDQMNHPQISEVVSLYLQETEPFRKVHRMIDVFEIIIKTHTAYIVGTYFHQKDVSDDLKVLFTDGLRTPSLGMWQLFNRVLTDELTFNHIPDEVFALFVSTLNSELEKQKLLHIYKKQGDYWILKNHLELAEVNKWRQFLIKLILPLIKNNKIQSSFSISDFPVYFYKWNNHVDGVINLRNKYSHGATPDNEHCLKDIESFEPVMLHWLQAAWLNESHILAVQHKSQELHLPTLTSNGESISLFPIMKYENGTLVFFNDLKKYHTKKITYLDYRLAEHIHDSIYYEAFLEVFKLEEWKQNKNNEFQARINELNENFKGREAEKLEINRFIESNEMARFLFINGTPGIGKSALLANFIPKNDQVSVIKYFIRRGTVYANPGYFLDYVTNQIHQLTGTKFRMGLSLDEKQSLFSHSLQSFAELRPQQKLVLLIDGLDEATEQNLLACLPVTPYKNVKIVYSGRSTKKTVEFYHVVPAESKREMTLDGLTKENILALLYEVVSKYSITNEAVETITLRSKGNPLYLKVLCDALERGEITLSNLSVLPNQIEDFYEAILYRFSKEEHGDDILHALYVIAAAKDFLTHELLQHMLNIGPAKTMQIIASMSEILYYPSEGAQEFQLFHESLREYLVKEHPVSIKKAERNIIHFCEGWEELLELDERLALYPLKYYSTHLLEHGKREAIYKLAINRPYLEKQYQLIHTYQYSFLLMSQTMSLMGPNDISEFLHVCAANANLHFTASSKGMNLLQELKELTHTEVEEFLHHLSDTGREEQVILYLAFLYYSLNGKIVVTKEDIKLGLDQFEKFMRESGPFVALSDFFPEEYLFELLVKMENAGLEHSVVGHHIDPDQMRRNHVSLLRNLDIQKETEYELYDAYYVQPSLEKEEKWAELVLALENMKSERLREKVLDDVTQFLPTVSNLYYQFLLHLCLSSYFAKIEKAEQSASYLETAKRMFDKIEKAEDQAQSLIDFAEYYYFLGNKQQAILYSDQVKVAIDAIPDPRERYGKIRQLNDIMDSIHSENVPVNGEHTNMERDERDLAEWMQDELERAKSVAILYEKRKIFKGITTRLFKFQKFELLFEVALSQFKIATLVEDRYTNEDYKKIAGILIDRSKLLDAELAISHIKSRSSHLSLRLMEKRGGKIAKIEFDFVDEEISFLAGEYSLCKRAGEQEKAGQLLAEIKRRWPEIDRPMGPRRVIIELLKGQNIKEAQECIELIDEPLYRDECKILLTKEMLACDMEQEMQELLYTFPEQSYDRLQANCSLYAYYERKHDFQKSAAIMKDIEKGFLSLKPADEKLACYDRFLHELFGLGNQPLLLKMATAMMNELPQIEDRHLQCKYCRTLVDILLKVDRLDLFTTLDYYLTSNSKFRNWHFHDLAMFYMREGKEEEIESLVLNSFGHQQRLLFVGLLKTASSEKQLMFVRDLLMKETVHHEVRREMLQSLIESCYFLEEEVSLRLIMEMMTGTCDDLEVFTRSVYGMGKYIRFLTNYEDGQKNQLLQTLGSICQIDHLLIQQSSAWTYDNLDDWIDTITDEDDIEDIENWAKRVQKGRMTKERFNELLQDIVG